MGRTSLAQAVSLEGILDCDIHTCDMAQTCLYLQRDSTKGVVLLESILYCDMTHLYEGRDTKDWVKRVARGQFFENMCDTIHSYV